MHSTSSLSHHRGFQLFWGGQTISSIGDAFSTVAYPLLVFKMTGSVAQMTAITACFAGGAIASCLVAGPIVDRFDRRRLLLTTTALRGLLTATVSATSVLHALSVPLLGALTVCSGLLANTFSVAYVAFVAELVSKAHVTEANARLQASAAAAFVFGPALAGVAAQRWGPEAAIGVDSLSFLVSLLLLALIRVRSEPTEGHERPHEGSGLAFILRTPVLRMLALIVTVENVVTAATLDLFTFHVKSVLGDSDSAVGLMFGLASFGAIGGSLAAIRAKRRLGLQLTYVITGFALAASFALAPLTRSFTLIAIIAAIYTFNVTIRLILSISRRQEVTPKEVMGRVTATVLILISSAHLVGAAALGRIASDHGSALAFGISAATLFVLAVATMGASSLQEHGSS